MLLIQLHHVFRTHQQRIDILETIKLSLVDVADDAGIVWSEMNWFISELWRKVCQVSLTLQPGTIRRRNLLLLQQSPVNCLK